MRMRSTNPVIKEGTFAAQARTYAGSEVMTVDGTMGKTAILLLILTVAASFTFRSTVDSAGAGSMPLVWGGLIVGLVLALIISFKPATAPFLAPVYAAAKGLMLGAISAVYHLAYQGIVLQAVLLTLAVALTMLGLYRFRVIRVTDRFRTVLMAAMGGIFLVYLMSFVLGLFGGGVPFLHSSGPVGIGISVVFIVVVSLSLLVDFDMIERGARHGAPKAMEWYGGFALLVTLIWLFLEMLRLLAKLQSRE